MQSLSFANNKYVINNKSPFRFEVFLNEKDIKDSFEFAYKMTFGAIGEHRNHRSGGSIKRRNGEIFINAFQGKLSEFAFKRFFESKYRQPVSDIDLNCWKKGQWDFSDFFWKDKKIAVKSAKHFSNLLLLECKDWNNKGEYIPNEECSYFMIVFVRVKSDSIDNLIKEKFFEVYYCEKETLRKKIFNGAPIICDIPGYIKNEDLIYVINNAQILPKNSILGIGTKIDADNYYVQSGDLRKWPEIKK